jgi:Integral membrane protein TerC family
MTVPLWAWAVGDRFFARTGGRIMATPLFVALVAIETTDLVFAVDSIPAIFGVTQNLFVIFTSNAFAVLGLRALYFLLAGSVDRFSYLRPAIAVLLVFIGVKMLISPPGPPADRGEPGGDHRRGGQRGGREPVARSAPTAPRSAAVILASVTTARSAS